MRGKRANMTRLRVLNLYLTERLMTAAQEIMKMVGDTVSEYLEETDRTRKENENLKRFLREIGFAVEAGLPKSAQPAAPAVPVSVALVEELQQQSSGLGQDAEPLQPAVKVELSEQQRGRLGKEEFQAQEPHTPGSVFPPLCVKNDQDRVTPNRPDVKTKTAAADEATASPDFIKVEIDGVDCNIEQPTEALSIRAVTASSDTLQSENSVNVSEEDIGGPASLSEAQHSKGKPSVLKGPGSHSCVYCGKVFCQLSRLKLHLRIHTGERPFRCTVCGKSFNQSGHLKVHERIHTGKKPYSCTTCGKCFNYSGKFKEHQRIHTGERPYRCTFCGKHFSQSCHLKSHTQIHTGEKPYSCPVCGKGFCNSSQIKGHLQTHSSEKIFA
ncbi:zinc finger and SCAN domain-containing protein 21-like [Megalops cyprinoides]|uniref:zinc finger and SCAN domain-containing protein 21-like n=1 Tax=Megalops cyprinoides TaxID=118141 RepID=UPI001864B802|nr:zinc finger and SCAN domain-containing protein 21-like [Megalops cyprinoides]